MSFAREVIRSVLGVRGRTLVEEVLPKLRANVCRPIRRLGRRFVFNPRVDKDGIREFGADGRHLFFGYYDLSPFSGDNGRLLAVRGPKEDSPPTPRTEVEIGYYPLADERPDFISVGRSLAWCWQQGCRLQWYPAASSETVLYNFADDGGYRSLLKEVESGRITREFSRPIYSATRDGKWGFSLNFSRLHRLRPGYGYLNHPDSTQGESAPSRDGIWRIDLETGDEGLLFSLAQVAAMDPLDSMSGAEHYFNHIHCNPGSTRLLFFHLWLNKGTRFSRLITCNIDGGRPYVLINEGHVSHYAWRSDSEILAYSTHAATGTGFHFYSDCSLVREVVGQGVLTEDGHPSYSPDGSVILLDSYPDRLREQHIFLFRCETRQLERVGTFFSPMKFLTTDVRCDLHPRWSHCGRFICFDSACLGKRVMFVVDLQDMLGPATA